MANARSPGNLVSRLRDFAHCGNGAAAVEFAALLPFMLAVYLGGVEIGDGVAINRKVTITARDVADLASQYTVIHDSDMTTILGAAPVTFTLAEGALPPGMTAEKIHAGIKLALADMNGRGWLTENCFINPDETAAPTVERRLAAGHYDCVVVGAGVRLPPSRLALFEAVVNAIHRAAPQTAIAFNSRPEDSGAAAARWI